MRNVSLLLLSFLFYCSSLAASEFSYEVYKSGNDYYLKSEPNYVPIASSAITIIIPTYKDGQLIKLSNSSGTWVAQNISIAQFNSVNPALQTGTSVSYSDLNGDGLQDIALVVNSGTSSSQIIELINDGNGGSFTARVDVDLDQPWNAKGGSVADVALTSVGSVSSNFNGVTPGSAGVSGGAATYSVPIDVPPGRNGVQPSVSIQYSSRSGNGIAGVGWNLSAGGAISRCPATYAQDGFNRGVTFNKTTDRLCLNGQRLMLESGTYGEANAVYKTEMDSFARVYQRGADLDGNAYFEVIQPDGGVTHYGDTTKSYQSRIIPTGTTKVMAWLVSHTRDVTTKNHMAYRYENHGNGEVLLKHIYYTGNSETSLGDRRVSFNYEDRGRYSTSYVSGAFTRQTVRLASVNTFYNNQLVKAYKLDYETSRASGRNLLASVQECGHKGSKLCREAITFDWQDAPVKFAVERLETANGEEIVKVPSNGLLRPIADVVPHGDANGDGVRDWPDLYVNAEGKKLGNNSTFLQTCSYSRLSFSNYCVDGDFNMDGRTDHWDNKGPLLKVAYEDGQNSFNWLTTSINSNNGANSVVSISDFNGDGWPDVVMSGPKGAPRDVTLYLHTKNLNSPYSTGRLLFTTEPTGSVQTIGDINGDGLADFAIRETGDLQYSGALDAIYLTRLDTNGLTLQEVAADFNTVATLGVLDNFSMLIDVNGDGLGDWLGWRDARNLVLKINEGDGTFGNNITLPFTMPTREVFPSGNRPSEPLSLIIPKYLDAFKQMDIDGDGRTELLMPDELVVENCFSFWNAVSNINWARVTRCGDDLYDKVQNNANNTLTDEPAPASLRDQGIYRYKALSFDEDADGNISLNVEATDIVGSAYQATIVDGFGKGLPDFVFNYGCMHVANDCSMSSPSSYVEGLDAPGAVYVTKNYGSYPGNPSAGEDYRPSDMLIGVQNGSGVASEWRYLPLTSGQVTNYYMLERNNVVDDKHFQFTSSMYAVAEFKQSNGVGSFNTTAYQYEDALYNFQGRGFRGFKKIIERDVRRGTEVHTDFEQVFPFTSLVKLQTVWARNKTAKISEVTNKWVVNQSHAAANTADVHSVFNKESKSEKFDLEGGLRIATKTVTVAQSDIDKYGNVTRKETLVEDDFGTYHNTDTANFHLASETWPHRLSWSKRTSDVVHSSDVADISSQSSTSRTVTTNMLAYSANRKPAQVTVAGGEAALSSSDCVNGQLNGCQYTRTDYNAYGLPTKVRVSGSVLSSTAGAKATQVRETRMQYSKNGTSVASDGYFPYTVTQENGNYDLTVTTKTAPEFGVSVYSRDAAGVSTTTSLDALARPIYIDATGAPRQYMRYRTPDGYAPNTAQMYVEVVQAGAPTSAEYKDILERTVKTRVQDFVNGFVFTEARYDELGRMTYESVPHKSGTPAATLYTSYDELDRLTSKVTPATQNSGEDFTTDYTYIGLTTTISTSASDGVNLNMSRSYNSLNQLMETEDDKGGLTQYAYDGAGNPLVIKDAKGQSIYAQYDNLGRKLWVDDPNQGKTDFTYNDFGEVQKEEDANGHEIYYMVDLLGRVKQRVSPEGTANFVWDTIKRGLPTSESLNSTSKRYSYDFAARVTQQRTTIDGTVYNVDTAYDQNFGRPKSIKYPNGLTLGLEYNARGYQSGVVNAQSGYRYQKVDGLDAWGNVSSSTLAAGEMKGDYLYSARTGQMLYSIVKQGLSQIHYLDYADYDSYGNLKRVVNRADFDAEDVQDNYVYDSLHRLITSSTTGNGASTQIHYGYDAVGNILKKTDYSVNASNGYTYFSGTNRVYQVRKKTGGVETFGYDGKGNLTHRNGKREVTYNEFNKPTRIDRLGSVVNLTYGADLMRKKQVRTANGKTITTHYIDKLFEVELSSIGTTERSYITDIAVLKESANDSNLRFTHKDRLGSTATITNQKGMVTARRNFDPFGKSRGGDWKPLDNVGSRLANNSYESDINANGEMSTRRGFTDHEHLDEVELIHMNGRVYDYNLGRFLSVDPLIHEGSQGINPYSYIMNNPLSGTDPTGYMPKRKVRDYAEVGDGGCPRGKGKCWDWELPDFQDKVLSMLAYDNGRTTSSGNNYSEESTDIGAINLDAINDMGKTNPSDNFVANSFEHFPVDNDDQFDQSDPTFHHYDTFTPFCVEGSEACTTEILNEVLFNFTYPAKYLAQTPAELDAPPVVAYVTNPLTFDDITAPADYDTPVGRVKQIRVSTGGIQNRTLRDHALFDGTITRHVASKDGSLGIWTHGIGINKFTGIDTVNLFLSKQNDVNGPKAFQTLDRLAKEYWRRTYVETEQ